MDSDKEYVDGVLIKEFTSKFGNGISIHFINEEEFLAFFLSKLGMYKGGLKLTAFKKRKATEYSTHNLFVNTGKSNTKPDIESEFSKKSDSHLDEIDDDNPF